ncbi:pentatricopeptide repeat-containing protein At1g76280 isoform X2 [Oryza brachyantha]|uniref:pentatricopeptide repeat-containing protein At1g76280 isoform X2 n=1 Tax=Oryza brachyantha TaxID=4533 RepID=UPI001ADB93A3|nr:pentatricopeptide repeat-containing protein At1g76280 isoform X2 [Oryza brachyantha]
MLFFFSFISVSKICKFRHNRLAHCLAKFIPCDPLVLVVLMLYCCTSEFYAYKYITNGVMVSEYDEFKWMTSFASRSIQADIVGALRRGDRQQASLLLLNLQQTNRPLTSEDFHYILEYCATAPDPLFVMEAFELMEEKAVHTSQIVHRSVTRALSKGGYSKEAIHWLTLLGEKDSNHLSLPIFNIFLSGCVSTTKQSDVEWCLEKMETCLLGKSEITYCELLKLAVFRRNLPAVHDIWKDCTRNYHPSIILHRKFVRALTILGDLQSAYRIMQHMVVLAGRSTDHMRGSSKGRYQRSRLDIPVPALTELEDLKILLGCDLPSSFQGRVEESEKYSIDIQPEQPQGETLSLENLQLKSYVEFISTGNNPSDKFDLDNGRMAKPLGSVPATIKKFLRCSFNDMIHACVQQNNSQIAEQLFLEMQKIGLQPSRFTYDGFIKAVMAGKGAAYAIKVIEAMERRGIEPYNDTLAALSVSNSRSSQLDLAEDLLARISKPRPKYIHAFNDLLAGCDIMNEPERAVRILAEMKHLNLKPNLRTYELLFSLFGNVNIPYEEGNVLSRVDVSKRISIIEMDMLNNEIQHSFVCMKNLIRALGAEGMIEEMLKYLNVAENVLWNMDPYQKSDLYCIALHALVKARDFRKAIKTFMIMRSCGLPANAATYSIMIECCKLLPCIKSANALLSLMLRDGFYPTILTFTSLLKVVLAREDFEGALDLMDTCITEGIQPDIKIFNAILLEAFRKGQIHVIEYIVECIRRAKIQPDQSTLWHTFCAYVDQELYNTAIEALQVLSVRMISEEADVLKEKGVILEDLILSEAPDAELRIMKTFEATEHLSTALLNLRWCAIMGSTISWSPEDSLWARRLASSYDGNRRPHIITSIVPERFVV